MPQVIARTRAVPIGVITNPYSKRNRTRAGWFPRKEELQAIVGEHGIVCETPSLEALGGAVERMLERGVRFIVSDGGDGTLHWLLNEVHRLAEDGRVPLLVPTCGGTINFVAHRAGISGQSDAILAALVRAEQSGAPFPTEQMQTIRIRGEGLAGSDAGGERFERLGFCSALAGVGQRFFAKYYEDARPRAFTIVKIIAWGLLSAACSLPGLRRLAPARWRRYIGELADPHPARVRVDGRLLEGERWRALDVGGIPINLGGVVRLFPRAGRQRLHLLTGNPSLVGVTLNLPRLVAGTRFAHGLTDHVVRRIEVEALGGVALDPVIDGERYFGLGRLEVTPGPLVRIPAVRVRARGPAAVAARLPRPDSAS